MRFHRYAWFISGFVAALTIGALGGIDGNTATDVSTEEAWTGGPVAEAPHS